MVERKFFEPPVLFAFEPEMPGDDDDQGLGTGQGGQNPFPCTYQEWLKLFKVDLNEDGIFSEADYDLWMTKNGWADKIIHN